MPRELKEFRLQKQKHSFWCWAAVSTSLDHYFSPRSTSTQCRVAKTVLRVATCCGTPTPAGCNQAAFLQDATHRIRFVYPPKHTSWMNQVELWFSILVRRVLRRGSFVSVDDLRQRILAFIDYFNQTMAKPFTWTYTGRPLTV